MNKQIIKILFVISSTRVRRDGKTSLYCRITFQKKRKQFATGLFINPNYWNNKKQKLLDKAGNSKIVNTQLSLISQKINEAFLLLQLQQNDFNVDDIYSYRFESCRDHIKHY